MSRLSNKASLAAGLVLSLAAAGLAAMGVRAGLRPVDVTVPEVAPAARVGASELPAPGPEAAYAALWTRPLRQAMAPESAPEPAPEPPAGPPPAPPVNVRGVVCEGPRSYAIIEVPGRGVRLLSLGEQFEGFTLIEVAADGVRMSRDGLARSFLLQREQPEPMEKAGGPPPRPPAATSRDVGGRIKPPAPDLDRTPQKTATVTVRIGPKDKSRFFRDVRLMPSFAAPPGGFRVESILGGSPWHDVGLRAGDVITAIDGRQVRNAGDLKRLSVSLSQASSWTVRRGTTEMRFSIR